jgi:hypothetical protein
MEDGGEERKEGRRLPFYGAMANAHENGTSRPRALIVGKVCGGDNLELF